MAGTELSDLLEHTYGLEELKNSDLVPVVSVNLGSGYDWEEFHAFFSPSRRRFFWASGAGCSCNSWHDGLRTLDDFENGVSRADVMAAMNRFFDESEEYRSSRVDRIAKLAEVNSFNVREHLS